jgi:tetratricopeptide (TPR) repeat protein
MVRRHPESPGGWRALSNVFTLEGQMDAALKAIRIADSLDPGNPTNRWQVISVYVNLERYDEAEQLMRVEMSAGTYTSRPKAQWNLAVLLRQVGRLNEALPLAHAHRLLAHEALLPGGAPYDALLEGQILFEQGRYREAAALFDSIAVWSPMVIDSSLRFGARIWAWTHSADAYAQLGDTARLRFLADTMEALGRSVAMARDQRLHAYVRGLLARLQGREDEALQWFERAMSSPTLGFTRVNYELAALYLKRGRARDAVRVLGAAYRGGTVDSNLYITRTDIEVRLAQAFEAVGQRDSALTYYRRVRDDWKRADEQFRPRRDSMEVAIHRLGG